MVPPSLWPDKSAVILLSRPSSWTLLALPEITAHHTQGANTPQRYTDVREAPDMEVGTNKQELLADRTRQLSKTLALL